MKSKINIILWYYCCDVIWEVWSKNVTWESNMKMGYNNILEI